MTFKPTRAEREEYTNEDNDAVRHCRTSDIRVLAIAAALKTEIPEEGLYGFLWGLNLRPFKFEPSHFFMCYGIDLRGSYLPTLSEEMLLKRRPLLKYSDAPPAAISHAAVMSAFDDCEGDNVLVTHPWAARFV